MKRLHSFLVVLVLCTPVTVAVLALADDQPTSPQGLAEVEYRAILREEIDSIGGAEDRSELYKERDLKQIAANARDVDALQKGLNKLAKDGWVLVAVEGGRFEKWPQMHVNHPPVYIFRRADR